MIQYHTGYVKRFILMLIITMNQSIFQLFRIMNQQFYEDDHKDIY